MCSKCKEPLDTSGRYCKRCRAAYMRQWRKTHPLTPEQRWKDNCRSHTRMLVKRGQLAKQPCFCGAEAEAHHPDYDRPALVIWRCREHHMLLH